MDIEEGGSLVPAILFTAIVEAVNAINSSKEKQKAFILNHALEYDNLKTFCLTFADSIRDAEAREKEMN